MMKRVLLAALFASVTWLARAEVQVIDGVRYECADGLCRMIGDDAAGGRAEREALPEAGVSPRLVQGYMDADEFLAFLRGETVPEPSLPTSAAWLLLALLVAGATLNLTPCVLPMVPVNLMVVGKSLRRGLLYGLGMATAYGTLGLCAASGGLVFGEIQSSPAFNGLVACVFLALGVALCGGFSLDFSGGRTASLVAALRRLGDAFPFFMGALSAALAGACVAPVLVSTLVLTADLSAQGNRFAWALPFVLGLGMALPWPFLGAGLRVLPRPGAWMRWVNRGFALLLFAFAAWYGRLAVEGASDESGEGDLQRDSARNGVVDLRLESLESLASLKSLSSGRPILVDCWATWCKNCAAMERGTLRDPRVVAALKGFTVVRLQCEDVAKLRRMPGCEAVRGLPAFFVVEP